jgi:hypothetical protein
MRVKIRANNWSAKTKGLGETILDLPECRLNEVGYFRQPEWQSIETAPKDGTWIMLFCPKWNDRILTGGLCNGMWIGEDRTISIPRPTHWMPLPKPPTK